MTIYLKGQVICW